MRTCRVHAGKVFAVALLAGVTALAQEPADSPAADDGTIERPIDEIIVTGSRIRRDTYSSYAPLQVTMAEDAKAVGLNGAGEILQQSIAATGAQAGPQLWAGWILEEGPGAMSVSLRGLGGARTLSMVNGRRIAPAGVEGAPITADLTLIPASLAQQYDVLLDGASSVYGSDAVAGVTNVILRRDFDGLEFEWYSNVPAQGGGQENTISAAWGRNFYSGFIGVGAEYQRNERSQWGDRRWTSECLRHVEEDESGQIRHDDLRSLVASGQPLTGCDARYRSVGWIGLPDYRFLTGGLDPGPGSVYFTPGSSNTGIPDFSVGDWYIAGGMDGDGDGEQDVIFRDYSMDRFMGERDLHPEFERFVAMAYGEYTFEGDARLTPFFELQFANRELQTRTEGAQFSHVVPADNPYNPCNPGGINGIDCVVAWNDFYAQQTVIDAFTAEFGVPPSFFGLDANGPVGPIEAQPVVLVEGDRNISDIELMQTRAVIGLRGDLPSLTIGTLEDWAFELAFAGSRSHGTSRRRGIRIDWLDESLQTSAVDPVSGTVVCGVDANGDGIPDGQLANGRPCVPVNLFAPSLFEGRGDFATSAEREFLFDTRDFDTVYKQWYLTGLIRGDLWELPGGRASAVLGFEYREDEIRSIPDDVARDALFFSFFTDGGAIGEKSVRELFAEVELPLLRDRPGIRELTVNTSARYTKDEIYGSDLTYAGRLGWRPVDSLLLRATVGTSFRAPNLREVFYVDPGSAPWLLVRDPCVVPAEAINPITGYDPALDPREPHVLQNCVDDGVDPTTLNAGIDWYRVDGRRGGNENLEPETSESWSWGFVWDLMTADRFDLSIGATYYEIDVSNSIVEPSADYVIDGCYGSATPNNVLCERITRDPDTGLITVLSGAYLNRDELFVSGYDINMAVTSNVDVLGRTVGLSADLVLNHPKEASETYSDSQGNVEFDDRAGEWGYPDWHGNLSLAARVDAFRFTWWIRYFGAVDVDPELVFEWSDIGGFADTCLGPSEGDLLCRDVSAADDYFLHTASLFYYGDRWTAGGGIRNVFDTAPPLVGHGAIPSFRNAPVAYGYDLNGRTYFVNIAARFD